MLVLSRKQTQSILIGSGVRITVVAIEGSRIRLGIEAPPEVTVLRDELPRRKTSAQAAGRERGTAGPPKD